MKLFSWYLFIIITMNFAIPYDLYLEVKTKNNDAVDLAMVTLIHQQPLPLDTSDNGYPAPGKINTVDVEITKFTNEKGYVKFGIEKMTDIKYNLRVRKYGYQDLLISVNASPKNNIVKANLLEELDPINLAASKNANQWLGAIRFNKSEDKKVFQMQCGFCHQFATEAIRQSRSIEEWQTIIQRMIGYGSRLPTDIQKMLPKLLISEFARIKNDPSSLEGPIPWQNYLIKTEIKEWPTGDSMSQVHDAIVGDDGLIYAADNIQDRLYVINSNASEIVVHKIPHLVGEQNGGLIAARLREFPKHDSTSNAHSLAQSKVDGHIFITPSAQQRLVEFIPQTGKFILHQMREGFYPHTIRIDAADNVWFTLALSNQVAKFDRKAKSFTYFDLPARSLKEKLVTKYMLYLFKLMDWGIPVNKWLKIDRQYSGTPLTYGIDITPDQKVWFSRLHTDEIGYIDQKNSQITLIKTPLMGPRRSRTDTKGNIWITFYGDSAIAKYDPVLKKFEKFNLPVFPLGSETPYALNYDSLRNWIWVTGNQSDALFALDLTKRIWRTFPLPRKTTFTRDIEFDSDGNIYVCNSNFPSWHIEDAQPTLIRVNPEI